MNGPCHRWCGSPACNTGCCYVSGDTEDAKAYKPVHGGFPDVHPYDLYEQREQSEPEGETAEGREASAKRHGRESCTRDSGACPAQGVAQPSSPIDAAHIPELRSHASAEMGRPDRRNPVLRASPIGPFETEVDQGDQGMPFDAYPAHAPMSQRAGLLVLLADGSREGDHTGGCEYAARCLARHVIGEGA